MTGGNDHTWVDQMVDLSLLALKVIVDMRRYDIGLY